MSRIPNIEEGIRALCSTKIGFPVKREWLFDDLIKLYVRVGLRIVNAPGPWLTLATFEVFDEEDRRKGLMRELFDFAEHFVTEHGLINGIYVESVNAPEILPFLTGRGYTHVAHTGLPDTLLGDYFKRFRGSG